MNRQSEEFQFKRSKLENELDDVQTRLSIEQQKNQTEISPENISRRAQLESVQAETEYELNSLKTFPTGEGEDNFPTMTGA